MKRIDCETNDVSLKLPPCAGALLSVTATLTRPNYISVPLIVSQSLTDADQLLLTLPVPTVQVPAPARGVWTLIVTTPCGCFTAPVYTDCPPPQLAGVHYPTAITGPSIECCIPDNAISFWVTTLDPPTVEAEGYPAATLALNDALNFQFSTHVTPGFTQYDWIDEDGFVLATGAFLPNGTTQFHDIDLTCALYALVPHKA